MSLAALVLPLWLHQYVRLWGHAKNCVGLQRQSEILKKAWVWKGDFFFSFNHLSGFDCLGQCSPANSSAC